MRLHYPAQEAVVKTTIVRYQRPGAEKGYDFMDLILNGWSLTDCC